MTKPQSQISSNDQIPFQTRRATVYWNLDIGIWDLIGIWGLVISSFFPIAIVPHCPVWWRVGMKSLKGHFLVASPSLTESNFSQAVVLMLQHDQNEALGVVVNR